MSEIKKAVLEGKTIPAPSIVDDEAYLRLGVPGSTGARTDGTQPKTCSPISYEGMPHNPLTKKGKKIMAAMTHEYGEKKGKSVFYASANAGRIKGVHK